VLGLGELCGELDASGELILCTMRLRQSKLEPLRGELNPVRAREISELLD
jgi:hypothetical protein